jgi:hypothetical protein
LIYEYPIAILAVEPAYFMHLKVQLPSTEHRDALVEAYSMSIKASSDYTHLRQVMAAILQTGESNLGLSCLLMKVSTMKLIRGRLLKFGNPVHMNAVFEHPLSLN